MPFTFYQTEFALSVSLSSPDLRLWILIMLFFKWGKQIKETNTKQQMRQKKKPTMLCVPSYDTLLMSSPSRITFHFCFSFHSKTYWHNHLYLLLHLNFLLFSTYHTLPFHSTIHTMLPNPTVTLLFSSSQQQSNMVNHFFLLKVLWLSSGTPLFPVFPTTLLSTSNLFKSHQTWNLLLQFRLNLHLNWYNHSIFGKTILEGASRYLGF